MTKASRDQGRPSKKEGEERREKKREREREREREKDGEEKEEERQGRRQVPSYEQASRDTPRRGAYLSVTFRNTPKVKREEGGVGGGRGLRSRQVPI